MNYNTAKNVFNVDTDENYISVLECVCNEDTTEGKCDHVLNVKIDNNIGFSQFTFQECIIHPNIIRDKEKQLYLVKIVPYEYEPSSISLPISQYIHKPICPTLNDNKCKALTKKGKGPRCTSNAVNDGYCKKHSTGESIPSNSDEEDKLTSTNPNEEDKPIPTNPTEEDKQQSTKCEGKTKKGEACKRNKKPGTNFCTAHQ